MAERIALEKKGQADVHPLKDDNDEIEKWLLDGWNVKQPDNPKPKPKEI